MSEKKVIFLVAGGTGGHIFPAHALAHQLISRGYEVHLLTDTRHANYAEDAPCEVHVVDCASLGGGLIKKLNAARKILRGCWQSRKLIRKHKPLAVVGFGGYPSFPAMFMAQRMKLPTVIHEQNCLLGQANVKLAEKADLLATSFDAVEGAEAYGDKVKKTGNPVRPAFMAVREMSYPMLTDVSSFQLLVMGGSQGARVFADILPKAIELLPVSMQKRLRIDQQCLAEQEEELAEAYDTIAVNANLAPFFHDVSQRIATSHLVISRAGASTIAELTVAGRPALLVPLPTAKGDHQTVNAKLMHESRAGWLMPQDSFIPKALADWLEQVMRNPDGLRAAAAEAHKLATLDADALLADAVEGVVEQHASHDKT